MRAEQPPCEMHDHVRSPHRRRERARIGQVGTHGLDVHGVHQVGRQRPAVVHQPKGLARWQQVPGEQASEIAGRAGNQDRSGHRSPILARAWSRRSRRPTSSSAPPTGSARSGSRWRKIARGPVETRIAGATPWPSGTSGTPSSSPSAAQPITVGSVAARGDPHRPRLRRRRGRRAGWSSRTLRGARRTSSRARPAPPKPSRSTSLFIAFALVSLNLVNFPLTVFTIAGGAVAIGVGFGSQNVMNNFISGLILLFERPIREGDLVSVEGTHGIVEHIGGAEHAHPRARQHAHDRAQQPSRREQPRQLHAVGRRAADERERGRGVRVAGARRWSELLQQAVGEVAVGAARAGAARPLRRFRRQRAAVRRALLDPRRARSSIGARSRAICDSASTRCSAEAGIVIAFPQRDVHLDAASPVPVRVVGGEPPSDSPSRAKSPRAVVSQGPSPRRRPARDARHPARRAAAAAVPDALFARPRSRSASSARLDEIPSDPPPGTVMWLDVRGFGDEQADPGDRRAVRDDGACDRGRRRMPRSGRRAEHYAGHLLVISRVPIVGPEDEVSLPQVCLVVGERTLVTFQEQVSRPVRASARAAAGRRRISPSGPAGPAISPTRSSTRWSIATIPWARRCRPNWTTSRTG